MNEHRTSKQKLTHERACPALARPLEDDCTCGLQWRIQLQTEQTLHAAWRKRAEEAEAELAILRTAHEPPVALNEHPECRDLAHSELMRRLPNVPPHLLAEIQQLSPWALQRRVLIQADWLGSYSRCLDGLGLKEGVDTCWNPRDIRRAVENLRPFVPPSVGPLKLDNDRQVFFYEQDHYYLSNFSAFFVEIDGHMYPTSEHAYHCYKFPDPTMQSAIRRASSAHEAFKMAERWKPYRIPDWDNVKADIMRRILRAKAQQHEYVRRKLLETGDRELIENSWRDDVWGWGPNRDGKNLLGKLWMEIRDELRGTSETKTEGEGNG